MTALSIAVTELRRFLRDRSNLFFVFVLPLLLVVFIGAQFGGGNAIQLGVVADHDDEATATLLNGLEAVGTIDLITYDDAEQLTNAVSRDILAGGIVVPRDLTGRLSAFASVDIAFVGRPDAQAQALRAVVASVAARVSEPFNAAAVVSSAVDAIASPAEAIAVATELAGRADRIDVAVLAHGGDPLAQEFAGLGQFDLGASSQLFLFVFLTSLAASGALIQSRRLGVARRMLSTPTTAGSIVVGQAAGRLAVAVTQAAYIVLATTLMFRVNWGDPWAAGLVIATFCLVAAGAGMLAGATFRNDAQASGFGVGAGMLMAALGGSMAPLEIFPDVMRTIALVTPHAWANNAMATIVRRGGGVGDVLVELGVLAAFAFVLLGAASVVLRRALTR